MRTERPFVVGVREGWRFNRVMCGEPRAVALVRAVRWGLTYRLHPGVRRRRLIIDLTDLVR
jgi:hypothetical protein